MKRHGLVEELEMRGVAVNRSWSVPELRSILIEQKEVEKPPKTDTGVKGLTKLSLSELVTEAEALSMVMPPKPTRGLLMRMIRDAKATPGQTVVSFGKFKGWMYHEIPQSYLEWSIQETKSNANAHVDLVRLATWAQGELEKRQSKQAGYATSASKDPEAVATVPPPKFKDMARHGSSSDSSWSRVGACSRRGAATRRGPEIISDSDLEEEPEDTNLTIKKLEDRIAALKKRSSQ